MVRASFHRSSRRMRDSPRGEGHLPHSTGRAAPLSYPERRWSRCVRSPEEILSQVLRVAALDPSDRVCGRVGGLWPWALL